MKVVLQQVSPEKSTVGSNPFQRLVLHSAVAAALLGGGYGRAAYAGSCTPGPVSVCSGPSNDGVDVTQYLSGTALTITTSPGFGIDTTSTGGNALQLFGTNGVNFTDANTSLITGSYKGIYALNSGDGALSITSTGDVTGFSDGIVATNYGTDLTLQTASVTTFYRDGIHARNRGSGALSITSSEALVGTRGRGISAYNHGTSLTLQTAAVVGNNSVGIIAFNYGNGPMSITSSGTVTGRYQGISARNNGSSTLSIVSKEAVSGSRRGIFASNAGTHLTLETAEVTSSYIGIDIYNQGTGALSITSSGVVAGTSSSGIGIYARNYGTELTIHTLEVTGGYRGIVARNEGSGALRITSDGEVTGTRGVGIVANNYGTNLTLLTAAVTGRQQGIEAWNNGSGALSLTSREEVRGGATGDGIKARNFGTNLTLQTVSVSGGNNGVYVRNDGSGALEVTSAGRVQGGRYGDGMFATNFGTDLTIHTTAVTGGRSGIYAHNVGDGELTISSSEAVTGSSHNGVTAANSGTDLTLQTTEVSGGVFGIYARNVGIGALRITSSEAVTGASGSGVVAINFGTDLTLQTATVTGGSFGISARNWGSGTLNVTSSGLVTGTNSTGIFAQNSGTNLTLQAAAVTSDRSGIEAINTGSGALSITTSGAVTATRGAGIWATTYGTDLILQTEAVMGGLSGIQVSHNGEGTLNITTNGLVSAGRAYALILTRFVAGTTDGTITNNGGLVSKENTAVWVTSGMNFVGEFNNNADITGGNGTAFDASATTDGIVLNQAAGTITGDVLLGSGDDRVNITGGSINGRIIGQGFGTVAIDVGAGNEFIGNGLVDAAEYVIQSGTVHQMADFSTAATTTTVASGATLSFNSLITGGGALVSNGELEFVLSPGSKGELVQAGTVTLNGGSTISVDAQGLSPILNESFQLISATSLVDNGVVLAEDAFGSLLYDFETSITSDSLSVVTTVADLGAISPLQNPSAFGDSMAAFVSGGGDNAVVELLAGLGGGDVAGFEQVADVFSPSVSGAVSQGAREANDSTWRLVTERFVGSETALNDSEPPNGVWLQGYDGTTDQDDSDHVEGFDADTGGVAVGYDLDLHQWRIGAAFSAGETDIDNDRFASDSIDIESNQFIVYGGYLQNQWFANATISAAWLDYDFKRNNMIAGEGPIKSDTDGDLLGMSVGGGYHYTVADNIILTPQLSLRYTTLDVDDYTEDGGLDLRVEYDDLDTLASELGVSASARYGAGDWQLAPVARLAWVHEYLDGNEKATARYAGQSYIQEGFDPDQDFASVGLGVQASNEHGVSISLDYRGAFGSDYGSNQGWLNVRYEF